jgi:hypothetical protein
MLMSENDLTGQIEWVGEEYGQRNFAAGEIFSDSEPAFEGAERVEMGVESYRPEVFLASTVGDQDGYCVFPSLTEDFDMGSFDMENEIGLDLGSSHLMGAESLVNDLDLSPTSRNGLVECSDDLTTNVVDHQCQSCGSFLAARYNTTLEASGVVISTDDKAMHSYQFPK